VGNGNKIFSSKVVFAEREVKKEAIKDPHRARETKSKHLFQ